MFAGSTSGNVLIWKEVGRKGHGELTVRKRRQDRGWHQYFLGFKRRINCESVPRLPAIIVRYFLEAEEVECGSLVWRWMYESQIKESLTLRRMPGLSQVEPGTVSRATVAGA